MEIKEVEPFKSLGINFKEINHSDFDGFIFEDDSKNYIEPDSNGYISDRLNELIDLKKKNTTIINASVGQGKTTAIIRFIERYFKANKYHGENYLLIIAAPYKSLIKQYKDKIDEKSGLDICFDYKALDEFGVNKKQFQNFHKKPVQLITVNSILGNAGQVALKQKDVKREYYESLIEYAERNNKKVVLIFDEVHEAIHNFKQELIFNLFKWNKVAHKIIVSSATFNEASKVVIKYLAELTEKKIKIYESKRVQHEDKLSDLHLCIYDQYHYKANSKVLESLLLDNTKNFDKIHILSYSKKLANEIYHSDLGKQLKERFGQLNLCTSKDDNEFNPSLNNIGTIFKTGISIEDENSAFFIILPPKSAYAKIENKGRYGIFSQGVFTITQALARPRVKADIFVITPNPDKLVLTPEVPKNYITKTKLDYLPFDNESYQEDFHDINSQDNLLKTFYKELKDNLNHGLAFAKNSDLEVEPKFPDYDVYKLDRGEDYFKYYYDIFGKNLSNYIYWAAWNNQFVNCKLNSIIKVSVLNFSEGNVQTVLDRYYNKTFSNNSFFVLNSDKDSYIKFRSSLFSNIIRYKKKGETDYTSINPYRNSSFEKQIITFIQRYKREFNYETRKKIFPPDGERYNFKNGKVVGVKKPVDAEIEVSTYLRLAMLYSTDLEDVSNDISTEEKQLINTYKSLYKYKEILLEKYSIKSRKGIIHLPIDKEMDFSKEHKIELNSIIHTLKKYDENLKSFSFLQKMKDLVPAYKLLREVFFETNTTSIITENGIKLKAYKFKPVLFPNKNEYINLIYPISNAWLLQSGNGIVTEEYNNDPNYNTQ